MNGIMAHARTEDQVKRMQRDSAYLAMMMSSPYANNAGETRDTYVEGTNASCSVYRPGADSTGGFWRLFFSLFGFE